MKLQNHRFAAIKVELEKNHSCMLNVIHKSLITRYFYSSKYLHKITYHSYKFTTKKLADTVLNIINVIKDYIINNGTNKCHVSSDILHWEWHNITFSREWGKPNLLFAYKAEFREFNASVNDSK